jgi:hypothetical protein
MNAHPSDLDLYALSEGSPEPRDAEEWTAHLASCPDCERRVRSYRALRLAVSLPAHAAASHEERLGIAPLLPKRREFQFTQAGLRPTTRREWAFIVLFSLLLGGWAGYLVTNPGEAANHRAGIFHSSFQGRFISLQESTTAVTLIALILAIFFPIHQTAKSKRAPILLWCLTILSCALSIFVMIIGISKTEAWPPWRRTAYPALWVAGPAWISMALFLTFLLVAIRLAFLREISKKIHGIGGIVFILLYYLVYFIWVVK